MEMKNILNRMLNHEELTREETKNIILGITQSEFPEEQITALLTGLQMRGVTVDELLGFRDGILETGVPAILNCDRYIDVVGTGGDRKNTFNISTTSCFVIAGAGYKVAKHGNFAATSVSGASNVIKNHGVQFTDDLDKLNRSLDEAGIVYLHAQLFAKAMKFVGPIRKALQFPTVFNLLGPLVNPSQPKCQLLGVANLDQMRLYNQSKEIKMKTMVSPSLLSANFIDLKSDVEMINKSEADWLHMDIMDGVFVPNISFGFPVLEAVAKVCTKPLDVHFMIVHPEQYIEQTAKIGAMMMNVHYEACTHLHRTIQQIHAAGMKAGVTLNPSTPVNVLEDIICDVDMVLLMSVNPGFGGQKFIENTIKKVNRLRKLIKESGSHALIEIDGGVQGETAPRLVQAGADVLVSGSYVFKSSDPCATIHNLKELKKEED